TDATRWSIGGERTMPKLTELYQSEQRARKAAEEIADRLARLQALTAALSQAVTSEQVVDVILVHALSALDAHAVAVAVLEPERREFTCLSSEGYSEAAWPLGRPVAYDSPMPLAKAVRERAPVILSSFDPQAAAVPEFLLSEGSGGDSALVALPLVHGQFIG